MMVEMDFKKLGGIIPVIAQDYQTNEILMLAYMNRDAWEMTKKTGYVHYWSRSRMKLWKKGEVSGNLQEVKEIWIDCDNDCLLIKINQVGNATCHTGYRSCFYRILEGDNTVIRGQRIFNPEEKYGKK